MTKANFNVSLNMKFKIGDRVKLLSPDRMADQTGVITEAFEKGRKSVFVSSNENYYYLDLDVPFVSDLHPEGLKNCGRMESNLDFAVSPVSLKFKIGDKVKLLSPEGMSGLTGVVSEAYPKGHKFSSKWNYYFLILDELYVSKENPKGLKRVGRAENEFTMTNWRINYSLIACPKLNSRRFQNGSNLRIFGRSGLTIV